METVSVSCIVRGFFCHHIYKTEAFANGPCLSPLSFFFLFSSFVSSFLQGFVLSETMRPCRNKAVLPCSFFSPSVLPFFALPSACPDGNGRAGKYGMVLFFLLFLLLFFLPPLPRLKEMKESYDLLSQIIRCPCVFRPFALS